MHSDKLKEVRLQKGASCLAPFDSSTFRLRWRLATRGERFGYWALLITEWIPDYNPREWLLVGNCG